MTGKIETVSISKLHVYESCALRAKLAWVDKIPDVQPRKAADRGTEIHTKSEDYVQGSIAKLPKELTAFAPEFTALKEMYKEGKVSLEGEWGFDDSWKPTKYSSAWLRIKADAVAFVKPEHAVIIDYKTGKRFGNEIKHAEQTQLYSIGTMIKYQEVRRVDAELWYLDQDELAHLSIKPIMLNRYIQIFDKRFKTMSNDTEFKPNPNIVSCKYCPYHPSRQNVCPYGV